MKISYIRGTMRQSHKWRTTVVRHSRDCRGTFSRLSRDIFSKLDRNSRICRINVYSMRLQCESCVYIVYLCCEIVANYSQTSLQLSHSSEIGALAKTKALISCAVTAQLIITFVFATRIVQFLVYLYPKFKASSLLL